MVPSGRWRAKLPQRGGRVAGLQVSRLQQAGELQQGGDGSARFVPCGQLPTPIGIGHPGGNEYATIIGLQFELQCLACAEASGNRKFATAERMKGILNRDAARIAGIVVV